MTSLATIVFDPVFPVIQIVTLAVLCFGATIWAYFRTSRNMHGAKRGFLLGFRVVGLILLFLILLKPSRLEEFAPLIQERVTLIALDTSMSMNKEDMDGMSRLEAAKKILRDAKISPDAPSSRPIEWYRFDQDIEPLEDLNALEAEGETTYIHNSVINLTKRIGGNRAGKAIVLFTDGHDFQLVNPVRTGYQVRSKRIPIYAVMLGKSGAVRDLSVQITSYQPYCYVKQRARIQASLRQIGCELEDVQVQLYRQGKLIRMQKVNTDVLQQIPVEFEVFEPEVGQFEYEVRVTPVSGESVTHNNNAISYLNVIDQQAKVLLMEAEPDWETTFLMRSLRGNEKFKLDALIAYAPEKVRRIRNYESDEDLEVPKTVADFNKYDMILLGRGMETLLTRSEAGKLAEYVSEFGGVVIFNRGRAFNADYDLGELEPVEWGDELEEGGPLRVARDGKGISPFQLLSKQEDLPDLVGIREVTATRALASTLAGLSGSDKSKLSPGFVQRRFGSGQVLSIALTGLWRWGFNAKHKESFSVYDQFWDQTLLWLLAERDFMPKHDYALRVQSVNILLGSQVHMRVQRKDPLKPLKTVPATIFHEGKQEARISLNFDESTGRVSGDYLPEKRGKYRVEAVFPNGETGDIRFMVSDENQEEIEVMPDEMYIRRMCESSGGRILRPNEIHDFLNRLTEEADESETKTRLVSVWDKPWLFYLIGFMMGGDWYLRRRWGLC